MANLLLVDDDLDLSDAFAEILRADGHSVCVARNGVEGLDALAREMPDLIISDVEMPQMDGPDMALQVFLQDLGRELIPILLTSGVPDLHRIAERVGTPYFLSKPFGVDPLRRKLQQALSERHPPRPRQQRSEAT